MNEKDLLDSLTPEQRAEAEKRLARLEAYQKANPISNFFDKHRKKEEELRAKYGEDFDKDDGYPFRINKAEAGTIAAWLEELKPEILAKQKADGTFSFGDGEPYYGTVGGGITYSFIPTGVGTILIVKESTTGKELNVTQALDWFFFG